jgi:hypothetical protein
MIPNKMSSPAVGDGNRFADKTMRRRNKPVAGRLRRIALAVLLVAMAPMVSGCADFDADKLDIFHLNDKKKLPGEREPVFPNGVPGVTQGIPKEYLKGDEQQQPGAAVPVPQVNSAEIQAATGEPPKAEAQAKPKPKPKRVVKHKPKPKPKPPAEAAPVQDSTTAAPQSTPSPAPWPASPPPGTFTR